MPNSARFELDPAAQHLRIGIRRFADEIFIVRGDREDGGIHTRKRGFEGGEFVAAEVEFYYDVAVGALGYRLFDGID